MRFAESIVVLSVILVAVAFLPAVVFAQNDAAGAITSAKQQLITCYDAALRAESAGANISSLTVVLNQAGGLLSRSELAYSQSDLGGAQSLASQCSQTLGGFVSQADALRVAAEQTGNFDFWFYVVGSIVGTFVVIVAGFVVWLVVKRRYVPVEVESEGRVEQDESP